MGLASIIIAILATMISWWFLTGALLMIVRRKESSGEESSLLTLFAMIVSGGAGLGLLLFSNDQPDATGACLALTGAFLVWSMHELAFLSGKLTGPVKTACPAGLHGWPRFVHAWRAVRDHEIALLLTILGLVALLYDGSNLLGLGAVVVLWVMRISSKMVLFLGAPCADTTLLPRNVSYLASYFETRRTTPLFPLFVAVIAMLLCYGIWMTITSVTTFQSLSYAILSTIILLALIEHFFLVLPVREHRLWQWALPDVEKSHTESSEAHSSTFPKQNTNQTAMPHGIGSN